ncbi:MAG: hypothetical protein NTW87_28350 [Planctomycetota bacterium]|nr:hypothetical protein [Planctomycetota bacterium]
MAGKTFPAALSEQDAVCGDYLEYVSQKRSWFAAAERALRDMREIKHNWNGYGSEAPNACALQNAEDVLDVLADEDFDLAPTNVVPSADNGVGISFRNGERYALIECYNTGEIAAVVSNGPGHADSWDVAPAELRQTIERFHDHLRGTHSA